MATNKIPYFLAAYAFCVACDFSTGRSCGNTLATPQMQQDQSKANQMQPN
jgi:hypothetical protein